MYLQFLFKVESSVMEETPVCTCYCSVNIIDTVLNNVLWYMMDLF